MCFLPKFMRPSAASLICFSLILITLIPAAYSQYDQRRADYYARQAEANRRQPNYSDRGGGGRTTCDDSCHPPVGDLLIGRGHQLKASSTCGLTKPERYCILPHLKTRKKCYICNSDERYKDDRFRYHRIEKIVQTDNEMPSDFWWQAENGVENVSIQLDLEAEFHFTHLIIIFQTFRPAAMIIERSDNFGNTWKVYQYFAYNCREAFPHVRLAPRSGIEDVVCESKYSEVNPSRNGEVIFSVLPQHIHIDNPYSQEVQNVIKITNLRINFTKLHTLGDEYLDQRQQIKEKYYYAISNMIVRGSCSCYGHASRCISDGGPAIPGKVYGKCECTHNTTGLNCDKCMDFYQDVPWQPAIGKDTRACKMCNCNNHTRKCRFDNAVYEASGRVSGGVCLECQHNTEGKNCELCVKFYYRDPKRRLDDPYICRPCDCDPVGSLEDGVCEGRDIPEQNIVAGTCHCKRNVDGKRCDRCKAGFWNLDTSNSDGCQACTCNPVGTIGDHGCTPSTGACICKRNVIGRDCDQCAPETYGLGDSEDGCKPCDCDLGGSYSTMCNVTTGQCPCRPHVTGRTCKTLISGYFAPGLDFLIIEAERSTGSANAQVIIREPYPGVDISWSGDGFMKVFGGTTLEFEISNVVTPLQYNIVVRYEPQHQRRVEAKILIDRLGVPADGVCRDKTENQGRVVLNPNERYSIVTGGPFCFENNKKYKVIMEFEPMVEPNPTLIDSLVLMPVFDDLSVFKGPGGEYAKREFYHYKCGSAFFTATRPPIPEVCKRYLYSISVEVFKGAHDCACDPTGSVSAICDTLGGSCKCKPNVIGRKCDICAAGYYGFGPDGCKPCDCHNTGAVDNICEPTTGQCTCRPGTYGRRCDECQPGYWNYPNCERCQCNGHAELCDSRTGICLNCRDNTAGPHCEQCEKSYYGNPVLGYEISCKPCPCPGIVGSGISHADSCQLDPRTQSPICSCHRGYTGERCDRCDNNYWGNPSAPGGECSPCDCNNNVDPFQPGNCNQNTGACLKCIYNTQGTHCETCIDGFYGNAKAQQCRQCVCNPLGTNTTAGQCEKTTGQCRCLPNVEGVECDQCAPNHWKLASGQGCESCNCDPLGSYSLKCHEMDGKCHCKKGHGGRQCNECEPNYWGDPRVQCFACDCNNSGSLTTQCHRSNGTCQCREGIAGDKCDRCARGYYGYAPHCQFCGECFSNWDFILQNLKDHTLRLLEAARKIKQTGTTGAYREQFTVIENRIMEIEKIIAGANVSNADVDEMENMVNGLKASLVDIQEKLSSYERQMEDTVRRTTDATLSLADLRRRVKDLETDSVNLKKNATDLQATNVEGAFNLTKDAQKRSRMAEHKIRGTFVYVNESESLRRETERLLDQAAGHYNRSYADNQEALNDINRKIGVLESDVPDVNELVCGGRGSVEECDMLCGGALCGKCGGLSCDKGAATKAGNALEFSLRAEEKLTEIREKANQQMDRILDASSTADEALREAQLAYDKALLGKNESENTTKELQDLLSAIEQFLEGGGTRPAEVRTLAEECKALAISLTPEQILKLAKQINETISSLTNIDRILVETAGDLSTANALKNRADRARENAENILNTAKQVLEALRQAADAQNKAQSAIDGASSHIDEAQGNLNTIADETQTVSKSSVAAQESIAELEARLEALKKKYTQNELYVGKAVKEAEQAAIMAKDAEDGARQLETKFEEAANLLEQKAQDSGVVKERAARLRERARLLAENATGKLKLLQKIEDEFDDNQRRLKDYQAIIDDLNRQMAGHLNVINERTIYHRDCVI